MSEQPYLPKRSPRGQFLPGDRTNPGGEFQPGQSGNPGGRSPKRLLNLDAKFIQQWERPCTIPKFAGRTWGDVFMEMVFLQALKGKARAIQEICERVGGKVPLPIRLGAAGDDESLSELKIIVVGGQGPLPPKGNGNGSNGDLPPETLD